MTIGGSVFGNILNDYGYLATLSVGGVIGTSSTPVTVRARDYVREISADRIYASVDAAYGTPQSSGSLSGLITTVGDFKGSLHALKLEPFVFSPLELSYITIAGDLDADMTFDNYVGAYNSTAASAAINVVGDFKAGRTIKIGQGLDGPYATTHGNGGLLVAANTGLKGMVIVNAANGSSTWGGDVLVGTGGSQVTLDPQATPGAYYTAAPSSLGGGAVGLAPFHLHQQGCSPAAGSSQATRTFLTSAWAQQSYGSGPCSPTAGGGSYALKSVTLEMYGPVKAESGTYSPISIYIDNGSGSPNTTTDFVATGMMSAAIVAPASRPYSRSILVKGLTQQGMSPGRYHVKPNPTSGRRLLCDGLLTGSAVPVADFDYQFWLEIDCDRNGLVDSVDIANYGGLDIWPLNGYIDCCEPCDLDYNQDGNVNQDDTAYLINAIGGAPNTTGAPLDVNHDGNVDQDDVAAFVNAVGGGGCP